MYVKVINGAVDSIVAKPNYFNNNGDPISDEVLINLESVYPVIPNPPIIDEYYQYNITNDITSWAVNANNVTQTFTTINKPISDIKNNVLDNCTKLRYLYETGGFIFNTLLIHSSRESQIKIYGSSQAARNDVRVENSKWKTLNGFVEMSNTDMISLGEALLSFVQGCYDKEDALITLINNVNIENYSSAVNAFKSIESTDFTTGWPTNAIFEG